MSRRAKKQLFRILEDLKSANNRLGQMRSEKNKELILDQLIECQRRAIYIGEHIEAINNNRVESVIQLENYCEHIYTIAEHLKIHADWSIGYPKCDKLLSEISQCMEQDLSGKLEVVFLPYKASMWDALESVWIAARDDKNCEDYVVPIPYYDKKPDGCFGDLHYEGGEYPDYVPVTNYEKYDLELRQPDVIFIHNPYDGCNYATSVAPAYYAKELRRFTDKLVYIPYFILNEIEPDDQDSIDKMKHFCFLPGIIYADKVIVQSENMRQIYINEYLKAAKQCGIKTDQKKVEKKILGLGSPKLDKISRISKDEVVIPQDWLKILEKQDSTWKKVIFYNIGLSSLLRYGKKMLQKMRWAFRVFKNNQNDIALLWRPHPLIKTVIKSLRPQLWDEYHQIVETYKSEGWGIYDETANVDRAVVLCDLYYGDISSVVQLCKKRHIPILVQNVDVIYEHMQAKKLLPKFCYGYRVDSNMYLPAVNYNMLFCLNLETERLEAVDNFHEEYDDKKYITTKASCYKKTLYYMPVNGKHVYFYHKDKGLKKIELFENSFSCMWEHFLNAFIIEKKMYLIPGGEDGIFVIDIETQQSKRVIRTKEEYKKRTGADYVYMVDENSCFFYSDVIYAVCYETPMFMEFDCGTEKLEFYFIDNIIERVVCYIRYERMFYALGISGRLYVIDGERRARESIRLPDGGERKMVCADGKLLVCTVDGEILWKINVSADGEELLDEKEVSFSFKGYRIVAEENNKIFWLVNQDMVFLKYDVRSNTIIKKYSKINIENCNLDFKGDFNEQNYEQKEQKDLELYLHILINSKRS